MRAISNKLTIAEIRNLLLGDSVVNVVDAKLLEALSDDPRIGVQKLVAQYYKRQDQRVVLKVAHRERLKHEEELWRQGYEFIAGIDEVGRGPLAGPVVAAAVILPHNTDVFLGINDSKTLSLKKREKYCEIIKKHALAYSVVEISPEVIDKHNIYRATQIAMTETLGGLSIKPSYLLIDAMKIDVSVPQKSIVKGDQVSLSIAAASIIAKVHRDHLMANYGKLYPEFEFEKNAGYGTKSHLDALYKYGYTPIHRQSFSPVPLVQHPYKER